MVRKRLKWARVEKSLLLNYVLERVANGHKIADCLTAFAECFNLPPSAVSAQWQLVAAENRDQVEAAKRYWREYLRPLQLEKSRFGKVLAQHHAMREKLLKQVAAQEAALREAHNRRMQELEETRQQIALESVFSGSDRLAVSAWQSCMVDVDGMSGLVVRVRQA